MYKDTVILIPAYNPSDVLVSLVRNLVRYKFLSIVVVNDGSDVISRDIFISLDNIKNCIVLRNDRNSGKGFSLKVGFKYILENFNCSGVLTVDSDGQHDLDSILKVSSFTHLKNDCVVIGTRKFNKNTPLKSYIGNKVSSLLFLLFHCRYLPDTQSGLRYISSSIINDIISLNGNHYDYELEMLIELNYLTKVFYFIDINTIYFDNNNSSHFKPLRDSYFIFRKFLKYSFILAVLNFLHIYFTNILIISKYTFTDIIIRFLLGSIFYIILSYTTFSKKFLNIFRFILFLSLIFLNYLLDLLLYQVSVSLYFNIFIFLFNYYFISKFIFRNFN